jgi:hypothetical protein
MSELIWETKNVNLSDGDGVRDGDGVGDDATVRQVRDGNGGQG